MNRVQSTKARNLACTFLFCLVVSPVLTGCNVGATQEMMCGDGTIDPGEECDDGAISALCDQDCTLSVCGDGLVNQFSGEACDDGEESSECNLDCTATRCGDGYINWTVEQCESTEDTDYCDHDCTLAECGDGYLNVLTGEECDLGGNDVSCDADCTLPACGDGHANPAAGEECDDGGDSLNCDADCTIAQCGDGYSNVAALETCDDGNLVAGDGCDEFCQAECQAASILTTLAGGNGHAGNIFDITAVRSLIVTGFDVHADPGTFDFEVWYRPGPSSGFEGSSAGWTMVGSAAGVVSNGDGFPTPLPFTVSVLIPAGDRYGFYVTMTNAASINYTDGTSNGAVYVSNGDIQIHQGVGLGYPFTGYNSPRIWNGTVYYNGCS